MIQILVIHLFVFDVVWVTGLTDGHIRYII
jgi:hypothetical protein